MRAEVGRQPPESRLSTAVTFRVAPRWGGALRDHLAGRRKGAQRNPRCNRASPSCVPDFHWSRYVGDRGRGGARNRSGRRPPTCRAGFECEALREGGVSSSACFLRSPARAVRTTSQTRRMPGTPQVPHLHADAPETDGTEFRFERPYLVPTPGTGSLFDPRTGLRPRSRVRRPLPYVLADPRSELDRFLVPRFPAESDMAAAHAVYDSLVGLGRSPYVAAAITSLLGTSAEALIGPLSEPSITIEVGDLRGGFSGTTFKDDRRIVLAAHEPLVVPVAGGVLAHEMYHLDDHT